MKSKLLLIVTIVVLTTSSVFICPRLKAQEIVPEEKHSLSIGAEGGWMRNLQSGSFKTACKCGPFNDGKGNSGIADVFVEFESNKYLSVGIKLGWDFKSAASSFSSKDTATVTYNNNTQIADGYVSTIARADISLTFLFIAPYITLTPFGSGFFIQVAPEFGSLVNSNLTYSRDLQNPIVLSNGDTIKNALFQNGTNKETFEDGPIQSVNKLRIAIFFSTGYDIRILNNLSIMPEASYNLPLTTVSNSAQSTNWEISSFVLALGIKYRFN
jgi:hypothetical protein